MSVCKNEKEKYQLHTFFANIVIQISVPEIFDDVTDDVTWTEWSPAFLLMSSKIAFEWCDSWLRFKWCILLIWMGDFIFFTY